jgi:hypothetical protein
MWTHLTGSTGNTEAFLDVAVNMDFQRAEVVERILGKPG